MRYLPKPTPVEAFQLEDGRYVVVPDGGEPRIVEAADFEASFDLAAPSVRRPTVADGIRAVVNGRPLPGAAVVADDFRPAADKMADAIAARTDNNGNGGPRVVVAKDEVERIIEETRTQIQSEVTVDATGHAYKRSPGKGRKACKRCDAITGARSSACGECGQAF